MLNRLLTVWALALIAASMLYAPEARAQASQVPPAEVCFQATTGINGMLGVLGTITPGSGGTNGTYVNVAIIGGSGTGATANITVAGGLVTQVIVFNPGINYAIGDTLSATSATIGNVTGFSVPVNSITINSSLAGGTVGMYIPGTFTPSQTWINANQSTLNTNPISLNANGCAIIYGVGTYRQILYDSLGNEVWDQLTSVAPVNPYYGGIATGTANAILAVDGAFAGVDGQAIEFLASSTNTGPVTINPSGYGAINVVKNTTTGAVALSGGEIVAGNLVSVTYSSVYNEFFLSSYYGIVPPNSLPSGAVSPLSFGAKCNGTFDDGPALQAAVNSLSSQAGTVQLPNQNCTDAGTLVMQYAGLHLRGAGTGATTLTCTGTGAADCIQIGEFPTLGNCVGSVEPANCGQTYTTSVNDMTLLAPNRTGGYLIDINGASQVTISDIYYAGYYAFQTTFVNNVIFERLNGFSHATSQQAINLAQPITSGTSAGWYRSDSITFNDFGLNAQSLGANCLNWDGDINTVRMQHVFMISCLNGMSISNSANSTSYFPQFLEADDLEIDSAAEDALSINAGRDFQIVNSYLNSSDAASGAGFPLAINPDTGFSVTSGIMIANTEIQDAPNGAAYIGAKDVTMANDHFFDTNKASSGVNPTVEVLATGQHVTITGSFMGQRYGDPNAPSYGIVIDSGAGAVSLDNNNFSGALTGNVDNLSANVVGWVGGIENDSSINTNTSCAATTAC